MHAGEFDSLLESLLGQTARSSNDSHDDGHDHDHGSQIHFRALPGQAHRPSVRRAPRLPVAPGNRIVEPSGKIRKLMLLLRFKDHQDRKLPDKGDYEIVLNGEGEHSELAKSGSARQYSREVSYQKMDIAHLDCRLDRSSAN
jgi:hypothetical protein